MLSILIIIGIISAILFIVSLVAMPFLVAKIPVDYFDENKIDWQQQANWKSNVLRSLKNVAGVIILIAGVIMLVTPGQGILSILLGIMLIDFPNKRYWERRLVNNPNVLSTLNWMRTKVGAEPLKL